MEMKMEEKGRKYYNNIYLCIKKINQNYDPRILEYKLLRCFYSASPLPSPTASDMNGTKECNILKEI